MPVNNQEEFPSEKASTFEEAKKIAQLRDEKKQAKEGHNFDPSAPLETPSEKSDQQSDLNQKNDDQPTTSDDNENNDKD